MNSILPLEAILLSPFMCVYKAIIAIILAGAVVSAVTLKSNGHGLESLRAGHLDKGSIHWKGHGM